MFKGSLFGVLVGLALTGCAYLGSVSTTSIPADRRKVVEVESARFIFLLLNFNNSYVDELTHDLAEKCPNGKVLGVLTKHENITYFPLIAHGVRITATGFCVEGSDES